MAGKVEYDKIILSAVNSLNECYSFDKKDREYFINNIVRPALEILQGKGVNEGVLLMLYVILNSLTPEMKEGAYHENGLEATINESTLNIKGIFNDLTEKKILSQSIEITDNKPYKSLKIKYKKQDDVFKLFEMDCYVIGGKIEGRFNIEYEDGIKPKDNYTDYYFEAIFNENGLLDSCDYRMKIPKAKEQEKELSIEILKRYYGEIIIYEKVNELGISEVTGHRYSETLSCSDARRISYDSVSERIIPYIPILIENIPDNKTIKTFSESLYTEAEDYLIRANCPPAICHVYNFKPKRMIKGKRPINRREKM